MSNEGGRCRYFYYYAVFYLCLIFLWSFLPHKMIYFFNSVDLSGCFYMCFHYSLTYNVPFVIDKMVNKTHNYGHINAHINSKQVEQFTK